jgi:hypothetical protein
MAFEGDFLTSFFIIIFIYYVLYFSSKTVGGKVVDDQSPH